MQTLKLNRTATSTHLPHWTLEKPIYAHATIEVERCWPSPVFVQLVLQISETDTFSKVIVRLTEFGTFADGEAYDKWFSDNEITLNDRVNKAFNNVMKCLGYIVEQVTVLRYQQAAELMEGARRELIQQAVNFEQAMAAMPKPQPPKQVPMDKYMIDAFRYIVHDSERMPDGRPITDEIEAAIEHLFEDDAEFIKKWATEEQDDGPRWLIEQLEEFGLIYMRSVDIAITDQGKELWAKMQAEDESRLAAHPLAGIELMALDDIRKEVDSTPSEPYVWKAYALKLIDEHMPSILTGRSRKASVEAAYETLIDMHVIYVNRYDVVYITKFGRSTLESHRE